MKTVTLGSILAVLPKETQTAIENLLNEPRGDSIDFARRAKELLRPHEAALATVEIIPDYFAYVLCHLYLQRKPQPQPPHDPCLN